MKLSYLLAAASLAVSVPAHATTFIEREPNDTLATAQILAHNGTINLTGRRESSPTNGFNDFFRFYAAAGDNIIFRVNTIGAGDPLIRLLDGLGAVLAQDDDGGGGLNSLINFRIATTGNYFGALRGFGNSVYNYDLSITGLTATPGVGGGVPEPATWAMMIIGFGLVGGAMRRRTTRVSYAA
jgi:Bacterial pre-peptidase C-terminal domain/PEP-CTERM motif